MVIKVYERLPNGDKGALLGEKEFPPPYRSKLDPTGGGDKSVFLQVAAYAKTLGPRGTLIERDEKVESKERAAFEKAEKEKG